VHRIRLTAPSDRPDFRQVPVFLWREGQNYDSDGDSFNPASREWTELYLCNREDEKEILVIGPEESGDDILTMFVESKTLELAARAAFYLATFMGGQVAVEPETHFSPPSTLLPFLGKNFDPAAALARAQASPFARSTLRSPYPNLDR